MKYAILQTMALGGVVLAGSAAAQQVYVVQDTQAVSVATTTPVRLPDGKVIEVVNQADTPWWKNEAVSQYRSYYYDSADNVYVVYDNPPWEKRLDSRWNAQGEPTGTYCSEEMARRGRCP